MPIFTSLLFFFLALAFLPLAIRNSRSRQKYREQSELENRMELGAAICIAAARNAFGVELDQSPMSIKTLDEFITNGWTDSSASASIAETGFQSKETKDIAFVFGAYLGMAFRKHTAAVWRIENGKTVLFFSSSKVSANPFELAERKLRDPKHVNLEEETAYWGKPPEPATTEEQHGPTE